MQSYKVKKDFAFDGITGRKKVFSPSVARLFKIYVIDETDKLEQDSYHANTCTGHSTRISTA